MTERPRPPGPRPRRRRPRRGPAAGPAAAAVVRRGQGRPRAVHARPARRPSRALRDLGFEVFVDLKLHDIPTTVERAASGARRARRRRTSRCTPAGGAADAAGRRRRPGREGAAAAGLPSRRWRWPSPCSPAKPMPPAHIVRPPGGRRRRGRVRRARRAPPPTSREAKQPGARDCSRSSPASGPAGVATHDQARPATPADALAVGRRPPGHRAGGDQAPTTRRRPPPSVAAEVGRGARMSPVARAPRARVRAMANPPSLTPEQRDAALRRPPRLAGCPCRAEGEAQDGLGHPGRCARGGRRRRRRRQDEGARRCSSRCPVSARSRPGASWRRSASARPAGCGASGPSSARRSSSSSG